jgi:hypothetical protein
MIHIVTGILLPETFLESRFFIILASLVALNTTIFAALSIVKAFPKFVRKTTYRPGNYRRETRSIYPDAPD